MILFAVKKPKIIKKTLADDTPELERICAGGCAVRGLNMSTRKRGTYCTKEPTTCIYQSTIENRIVSDKVKLADGSIRYMPQCMVAPDYQQIDSVEAEQ